MYAQPRRAFSSTTQIRPEKQFFSAGRPEFMEAVKLEVIFIFKIIFLFSSRVQGAILIKHPPPQNPVIDKRLEMDDKNSTPSPLRTQLTPEEVRTLFRIL